MGKKSKGMLCSKITRKNCGKISRKYRKDEEHNFECVLIFILHLFTMKIKENI